MIPDGATAGSFTHLASWLQRNSGVSVRYGVAPTLAFPAHEIHRVVVQGTGSLQVSVTFLGLVGPSGVLPRPYTELLIHREAQGDSALQAFLNLFHHRMLDLFHRVWRKPRLCEQTDGHRLSLAAGGGCLGPGKPELGEALWQTFAWARLRQPVAASTLVQVVQQALGVGVALQPYLPRWRPLPHQDRLSLGRKDVALGQGLVLGARQLDVDTAFRLRLGPLSPAQFETLLPGGEVHAVLQGIVEQLVGPSFEPEVQLQVEGATLPRAQIGADAGGRLGRNLWMGSRPRSGVRDDATFVL